jgi:hypothetical protein
MLIKKYFTRPAQPRGIKLQEYDYRILALLDEYRFLDTLMIWHLVKLFYPEMKLDALKHRLHALWRNGFIDRPPEQVSLLIKRDDFHLISCLTEKGARVVAERFGRSFEKTLWRVNQERANFRLLEHQLAISRFRAAIQLAQSFEMLLWLHDRQFRKSVTFRIETHEQRYLLQAAFVGEQLTCKVEPDSFFILRNHGKTQAYALEIDRGTASRKALARKYLAYYKMLKALSQHPFTIEGHEIRHFRVLTVTSDERYFERPGVRIKHLRELIQTLDEKGQGYRAFWFTSEDQFSWQNPQSILKPIWQTPKEGELLTLID